MGPIPIEDEVAELSFGNDYAIGGKGIVSGNVDGDAGCIGGEPSGAGQAVHGRVDGVAGALAGKVGDEQIDGGVLIRAGGVVAGKEFAGAQDVEGFLVDDLVGSVPCAQLRGELFEWLVWREELVAAVGAQIRCGGRE